MANNSAIEIAIKEKEAYENKFTEYVETLRAISKERWPDKLQEMANFRKFPVETLEQVGIFYIGEMAELLVPEYLKDIKDFGVISPTNKKPIFHHRWVIPIYNEKRKVQNLVGYSPSANERYIYGTARYYRRRDTMYGLENLHLAYELGYAVYVEGITDAIRLRSLGILNTFANCGTHASPFILAQLNRCEYGIIRIPDRDAAGNEAKKGWITNRYITLNPSLKYKDIDELLREDEGGAEWFMSYFNECVRILKSMKHMGNTCPSMEITMI